MFDMPSGISYICKDCPIKKRTITRSEKEVVFEHYAIVMTKDIINEECYIDKKSSHYQEAKSTKERIKTFYKKYHSTNAPISIPLESAVIHGPIEFIE